MQTDVSTSADFIDRTEIAELLLLVPSRHRYVKHLSFHLSSNDPLFSAILKVLPSLFIFKRYISQDPHCSVFVHKSGFKGLT